MPTETELDHLADFEGRLAVVLHATNPEARDAIKGFWRRRYAEAPEDAFEMIMGVVVTPHGYRDE